jgi:NADPH2:quinone reductase
MAAIQLGHEVGGRATATAGTDEKVVYCTRLGAELAINYKKEDFVERILAHTSGQGVEVILDNVGVAYLERNIGLLKLRGSLGFYRHDERQ